MTDTYDWVMADTYRTVDEMQRRAAKRAAAIAAAEQWAADASGSTILLLIMNPDHYTPGGVHRRVSRDGVMAYASVNGHALPWTVFTAAVLREIDRRFGPLQQTFTP